MARLKTSLDSGAVRDFCQEGKVAQIKAAQAEEIWNTIRCIASDHSVGVYALQREVVALKWSRKGSQAEACRLTETHARIRWRTLRQQWFNLNDHHRDVWSFYQRTEETDRVTINFEQQIEAVFSPARCSTKFWDRVLQYLARFLGVCLIIFRKISGKV